MAAPTGPTGPSTPRQQREITAQLVEEARLRQEINSGLDAYLEHLEKIKALNNTIKENEKVLLKLEESKIGKTQAEIDLIEEKIQLLSIVNEKVKEEYELHKKIVKEAKVGQMVTANMLASMAKGLGKLPGLVKGLYGEIEGSGLFEMDKAIKQSGLQMGLLGSQSKLYQATIKEASLTTNELGMGVKELAEMQAGYSEELGRAVQLSEKGLEAMTEMAAATVLGAEGAAKLSAEMDLQGYSAERTRDYIQQTMDDSTKLGLNASKVIKNIQSGMKMLNKYNFKDGAAGLAKMAKTVAKLGIDMEDISGFADKLMDIEGAVDMSAQLQVMGGEWAKMADPFTLMYKARNDIQGLTEDFGKAAESVVSFNNKTKEFEVSALEMSKVRNIADKTGMSLEKIVEMGKKARKATDIKKQMSFNVNDPALQDFLVNQAEWNDKGEASIMINGSPKLLKELTSSDESLLKSQKQETETLKERARNAQDFDTKLTNLINMMKTTMLPIVEGLDKVLGPLVKDLFANDNFKSEMKALGVKLGEFVEGAANIGKWVANLALALGPTGTLVAIFGTKVLFSAAQWFVNGLALAGGFNAGTKLGEMLSGLMGSLGGPIGILAKSVGVLAAGVAGWAVGKGLGGAVSESMGNKSTKEGDTASMWGAGIGAALALGTGAALAIPTGGLSMLGAAALVGGGALVGSGIGKVSGDAMNQEKSPTYGGKVNDAILSGGKLTPIDNKDDLVAYKPNGPVDNAISGKGGNNSGGTLKVEFGEIHFKFDELTVSSPGTPGIAIELIKDPKFIRDITRMVHVETNKVISGGKVNPSQPNR